MEAQSLAVADTGLKCQSKCAAENRNNNRYILKRLLLLPVQLQPDSSTGVDPHCWSESVMNINTKIKKPDKNCTWRHSNGSFKTTELL